MHKSNTRITAIYRPEAERTDAVTLARSKMKHNGVRSGYVRVIIRTWSSALDLPEILCEDWISARVDYYPYVISILTDVVSLDQVESQERQEGRCS